LAISPPSDIVLDVVRAADPLRYSEAAEKLSRIGGILQRHEDGLFEAFDSVEGAASANAPAGAPNIRDRLAPAHSFAKCEVAEPIRRFEAFVLQSFIETMLPDNAVHVFGAGNAGAIWKSFLAEEIGKEIASAGGIGIAEEIAASLQAPAPANLDLLGGRLTESRMPRASASAGLMAAPTKVAGYVAALELDFADALRGVDAEAPSLFGNAAA
jgi:hypothetical protein